MIAKAQDTTLFNRLLFMTITVGGSIGAQFGVVIVIAHVFGVEGMGIYAFHFAIASLLGLVSSFGFPVYLQRELSARPNEFDEIHSEALSFKLILDAFILGVAFLLPVFYDFPRKDLFFLFVFTRIIIAYNSFFLVEFRVMSAYKLESILTSAGNLLYFILALVTAYLTVDLVFVASALLVSKLFVMVAVLVVWKVKSGRRLFRFSLANIGRTVRMNVPYALDQGLGEFLVQMISFLIGLFLGTATLGLYQAGQRITNGVLTFTSIIMGAFIGRLSAYSRTDYTSFRNEAVQASFFFHGIGLLALFIFSFGGDYITALLYPDEFQPLNALWPLFGLYVACRYVASVPGLVLTAAGFQKIRVQVNVLMTVLILSLFGISIQYMELAGLLWVLIGTSVLTAVLYYSFVYRHIVRVNQVALNEVN